MKILDQYIGRMVVMATLGSLLVLVSIDAFFAFVGEIGDIGRNEYGVLQAFQYIGLTLPRRVYDLITLSLLLGGLIGLGTLAGHSELLVVRAAGVSVGRIVRAVLQAGFLILVAMVLLGEFVVPPAEQFAQSQRELAQSRRITFKSDYGFWARDGNYFINIQQILPGDRLGGIFVYEFDEQRRLRFATRAESARYQDGQWVLEDVRRSVIGTERVVTKVDGQLAWDTVLSPDLLNVVVVKPENLSARDLARYVSYLTENGLETNRYRVAFWSKLIAPVSGLVMLFLAVPVIFGPLRSVPMGQRILVGLAIGFGYYLFAQTTRQLAQVYDLEPMMSVFAPPLLFYVLGLLVLRRVR